MREAGHNPGTQGKKEENKMWIVNAEIEEKLLKKGYVWNEMVLKSVWGYTYKFNVYLDGKFVEQYDANEKAFFE